MFAVFGAVTAAATEWPMPRRKRTGRFAPVRQKSFCCGRIRQSAQAENTCRCAQQSAAGARPETPGLKAAPRNPCERSTQQPGRTEFADRVRVYAASFPPAAWLPADNSNVF